MTKEQALLQAKTSIAREAISIRMDTKPPPELTDQALFVLTIIRNASQYAEWKKNHGSLHTYKKLLEKELQPFLNNGMVAQRELDQFIPIFEAYQEKELDPQFGFLHAFLNLVSQISDKSALELIREQSEESLRQRAQSNPSVVQIGVYTSWRGHGPDDDGDWDGRSRGST